MYLLANDHQYFYVDLLSPPQAIPKATVIQQDEGDSRLALTLDIAKNHMAEPQSKIHVPSRRYSVSCTTFRKYTEVMMSGSQGK